MENKIIAIQRGEGEDALYLKLILQVMKKIKLIKEKYIVTL